MEDNDVPKGKFLGVIDRLIEGDHYQFARLRPIRIINDGLWEDIVDDKRQFPDEGMVFWWGPPHNAIKGSFWIFTLSSQHKYRSNPKNTDKFQVDEYWRPYQAMSLRGVSGPRSFRRTLASGTLIFDNPILAKPLVRVVGDPGHWLSLPDGLPMTESLGKTTVDVSSLDRILPVHHVDSSEFYQLSIDGDRFSLLEEVGFPDEYQCSLSDAQLMERLRKRISKIDSSAVSAIGVTKKLLQQYVDSIDQAGLGSDEALKEASYEDAAETIVTGLENEVEYIKDFVKDLTTYPLVQKLMREDLNKNQAESVAQPPSSQTNEDSNELSSLQRAIEAANKELLILQERIESARADLYQGKQEIPEGQSTAPSLVGTSTSGDSVLNSIEDVDSLKSAVTAWCIHGGLDPYTGHSALAAVMANPVTAICGARAEAMGTAIASTLAGDNAVRVSVSSAVFGLCDLLCEPVTTIGATSLNGTALLGDYLADQKDDAMVVVLLSGFNRVPPEVMLQDLLPDIAGERRLAWTYRNGEIRSCNLPKRVRFVVTLIDGETTHLIPNQLSNSIALIPADYRPLQGAPIATSGPATPSRIFPTLLDDLQSTTGAEGLVEQANWLNGKLLAPQPETSTRILSTYFHFMGDSKRAQAEAMAALLSGRPWQVDMSDLPGPEATWIRQHLESLTEQPAWEAASHHFVSGVES